MAAYKTNRVICMTVMQHFGAPTRLLDWTKSVAAAAYFACIDKCRRNGSIWWISEDAIVASVHDHWEARGFRRKPELGCQIDLNDGIFKPDVDRFICMQYLSIPFPRARVQRGLFTIASRLGIAHDMLLKKQVSCVQERVEARLNDSATHGTLDARLKQQLSKGYYGRITIPANLKGSVIDYLQRIGIDAVSLQHAGADWVGLRMAWKRELLK